METIITANIIVFVIVSFIGTIKGFDLKKWSSWLYGLYGFISDFLAGFLRKDDAGSLILVMNLVRSLQLGVLFAFAVMMTGAINRWQKQHFVK